MKKHLWKAKFLCLAGLLIIAHLMGSMAFAAPLPGGTLDPTTIPKYVIPLVIPPELPKSVTGGTPAADYNIAVRQFKQQILPGGLWDQLSGRTDNLPATTVWSYGRAEDPAPNIQSLFPALPGGVAPAPNSSFNFPAFTVEATSGVATKVRWINDLVDSATGNFLPHLLPVDQTLHWANPPTANCVMGNPNRTDCETAVAAPYTGPVPIVTHVHGAHVQGHSDGYPEAWWLPAANNIPAGYSLRGSLYGQADNTNNVAGSAFFTYENTQPAATIWYHDHALGMTRLNVYAGPAGFWLIRGGAMIRPPVCFPARPRPARATRTLMGPIGRLYVRYRSPFRTAPSMPTGPSFIRRIEPSLMVSPGLISVEPVPRPVPRTSLVYGIRRPSSTPWWSMVPPGRNSRWPRPVTGFVC